MMNAWKNTISGVLYDIQSIPGPLPAAYDPAEWELVEISEAEITEIIKVAQYTHTARGISGLFENLLTTLHPQNLEEFV